MLVSDCDNKFRSDENISLEHQKKKITISDEQTFIYHTLVVTSSYLSSAQALFLVCMASVHL